MAVEVQHSPSFLDSLESNINIEPWLKNRVLIEEMDYDLGDDMTRKFLENYESLDAFKKHVRGLLRKAENIESDYESYGWGQFYDKKSTIEGISECLDELRDLSHTYGPFLKEILEGEEHLLPNQYTNFPDRKTSLYKGVQRVLKAFEGMHPRSKKAKVKNALQRLWENTTLLP